MKKIELKKILIELFPRFKNMKLSKNSDLLKITSFDSLDLITLISYLNKKYNFNVNKYQKKKKFFSIQNLEDFINS
jgi:acyl carrier protein